MKPVEEMSKKELVAELKKRKLNTSGLKDVLKERLSNAIDLPNRQDNSRLDESAAPFQPLDQRIREVQMELEMLQNQQRLIRPLSVQLNHNQFEGLSRRSSIQSNRERQDKISPRSSIREQPMNFSRRNSVRSVVSAVESVSVYSDHSMRRNHYDDYNGGNIRQPTNYFTFKDIEDSMNTFCGSDNYSVKFFVEEFEQNARMLNWDDDQKVVYAKRLLRGKAKLLVRTVFCSTWIQLKTELTREFGTQLSYGEAHRLLQSTKMKSDDDLGEYVLKMREIGKNNDIDELSITQYIIEGIYDNHSNKAMLYGATNIYGLKVKLEAYKKFKSVFKAKAVTSEPKKSNGIKNESRNEKDDKRCHLCGDKSHFQGNCPTKEKGVKCFKCNEFGHRAIDKDCPKYGERKEKKDAEKKLMCLSKTKSMKKVCVNDVTVNALVDTGSEINAIKKCVFEKLKTSYDVGIARKFYGAGGAEISTNKFFVGKICIDGESYESKIYIMNNDEIYDEMIIGMELLYEHEVIFNRGDILIKKMNGSGKTNTTDEVATIMNVVSCVDVNNEFNEHPECVKKMIESYDPKPPKDTSVELNLQLSDEVPVYQRARRLAPVEKNIVDKQITEWLKNGVIEAGKSEYASPIVIVKKKDGSSRICVDYRKLNKKVIKDRFPTPLMEDVIDCLQGANVYSTIDLENGFFHVPVGEQSKKYLSFITHSGQYLFRRTPFGCCNSPAVFHRFINTVFHDLIMKKIVIAYMDDICILAKDDAEAIQRLEIVFKVASEAGLRIKWKKCQFLKTSIEFLGFVIGSGTIKPSTDKTKAIQRFKELHNVKSVQSFLGLTGAFRKFIRDYALIARPLTNLLRKEAEFKIGDAEKKAFDTLKAKMSGEPVLKIYKQGVETHLYTDASKLSFGAILMQKSDEDDQFHPVHYMSIKTSPAEEKYDSYSLEVLAIVKALEKFRHYLLGMKFKVITDCEAFKKTMDKANVVAKVARWVMAMQEFDFEVEHRSNAQMKHVDALSRVMTIISSEDNLHVKIRKVQQKDDDLNKIRTILQHQDLYDGYLLRNDILYKVIDGRELLVVPKVMEAEVIRTSHDNGHFGVKKVEESIGQQFFIPKAKEKIQNFIGNCVKCILAERKHGKSEGFLHPIGKGDSPLDTYHVDHMGPMVATCKMYKHLFVVVDAFTKFTWIYPTKTTNTKEVINKLRTQQEIFGNPRRIISDKGAAFTSHDFTQFCEDEKIQHITTTTGIPRSNGQVERINRCIIPVLTKLSLENPSKWYKFVPLVQQALNSTFNRSIANSPFKLLFGVNMKRKHDLDVVEAIDQNFIDQFQEQRNEQRNEAKRQIENIQHENAKGFNDRRKSARTYTINELVAIRRTQFVNGNKLAEHFFGPYRVSRVKPNDRYDVIKEGFHSGPKQTSTSADYMKPWCSSEADE